MTISPILLAPGRRKGHVIHSPSPSGPALPPPIVQKLLASDHYDYGAIPRSGYRVQAVVSHVSDGPNSSLYGWFASTSGAGALSTHYAIFWDGTIEQYVLDEHASYGVGLISLGSDFPNWYRPQSTADGWMANCQTISIEHLGRPGQVFPAPQIGASIELQRYLRFKFSLPVDVQHFVGHYRFDHVNRANCPSSTFPWAQVLAGIAA